MPNSATSLPVSPFVSPAWLYERLHDKNIAIVDGSWHLPNANRDGKAEYLAQHIEGAVYFDINEIADTSTNLPHMLASPQDFAKAVGAMGISEDKIIVVYDGTGLFSAPRVWWNFKIYGAKHVYLLEGGLPAWRAAGYAVTANASMPKPAQFTPSVTPNAAIDKAGIARTLHDKSAQVVDARPAARFKGEAPEPRPIPSGHMPGALNLPFDKLVVNGKFLDADAMRKVLDDAGISLQQPVITSCGSGVSAAILAVAFELLGHPVQAIYDGSWAEWAADEAMPIANRRAV